MRFVKFTPLKKNLIQYQQRTLLLIAVLLATGTLTLAQPYQAAYWTGYNPISQTFPKNGTGVNHVTSASLNFSGLTKNNDGRTVWTNPNTAGALNTATAPYLSYTISTDATLNFDRFVMNGFAVVGGSKLQLRWSVDNYATSLGEFRSNGSNYTLTSVQLGSKGPIVAGNIIFRIYFYAASGSAQVYNPDGGVYSALDGTPASYRSGGYSVSLWYSSVSLVTLPIDFHSFTARATNDGVLLNWATASEQNNSHFEVERSANGVAFEKIGKVAGADNSNTTRRYQFTDIVPLNGTNYYRLKQVDIDGKSVYSDVQRVKTDNENFSYTIVQNPVAIELRLNIQLEKAVNLNLEIRDLKGSLLVQKQQWFNAGNTFYSLPVGHLAKGMYSINIYTEKGNNAKSFVKQ